MDISRVFPNYSISVFYGEYFNEWDVSIKDARGQKLTAKNKIFQKAIDSLIMQLKCLDEARDKE
jgi:hypothetical protein